MTRFRWRDSAADGESAREALARAVAVLRQDQRHGIAQVPVADMLRLLGAAEEDVTAPRPPARDPLADPITGTMWAGAPGSAPPG